MYSGSANLSPLCRDFVVPSGFLSETLKSVNRPGIDLVKPFRSLWGLEVDRRRRPVAEAAGIDPVEG